jgi:exodeoxyribonuclease V alpha subunit
MTMHPALARAVRDELVNEVDLHALDELSRLHGVPDLSPALQLILAMALKAGPDGDTCLDVRAIGPHPLVPGQVVSEVTNGWLAVLRSCPQLVEEASGTMATRRVPFVLDGARIYTARTHHEELSVGSTLRTLRDARLQVVLGGPGTGKTTYIAGELIRLFTEDTAGEIELALVAPTGKAARRMRQSLMRALSRSGAPDPVKERILAASRAQTVHKLLKLSPGMTPRFQRNNRKPLTQNLVIVDEASMMSLSLMYRLLDALPPGARMWLVGDPDQLASVDAGTVLGDIDKMIKTQPKGTWTHEPLTEQHRYPEDSTINTLVKAVRDARDGNEEDIDGVIKILRGASGDVEWLDPSAEQGKLNALAAEVVGTARAVVDLASKGDAAGALAALSTVQVLCAHRNGTLGVQGWNRTVQSAVPGSLADPFYVGRPVLVSRNDDRLGVANGDVGIVCLVNGQKVVAFEGLDGPVTIPLNRLPEVETVYAMTIHKSQGSEYEHAIVVLPTKASRILTRELLYTGISRPTKKLTIVATEESIRRAVGLPIRRATGLADRL